jgi:hypothetical protein
MCKSYPWEWKLAHTVNQNQTAGNLVSVASAKVLMEYGHYRLAFDFNKAYYTINSYQKQINSQLIKELNSLTAQNTLNLIVEVYYKAQLKLRTKQYADFLIFVVAFQENLLRYLLRKMLFNPDDINKDWSELEKKVKEKITKFDSGKLLNYLQNYTLSRGDKLKLDLDKPNRMVLQAIFDYDFINYSQLMPLLNKLNDYAELRNSYIHNLKGISELNNAQEILNIIKDILQQITNFSTTNPFDSLNQEILNHLTNY